MLPLACFCMIGVYYTGRLYRYADIKMIYSIDRGKHMEESVKGAS